MAKKVRCDILQEEMNHATRYIELYNKDIEGLKRARDKYNEWIISQEMARDNLIDFITNTLSKIDTLEQTKQIVIKLRLLKGLTYDEIGEYLNVEAGEAGEIYWNAIQEINKKGVTE